MKQLRYIVTILLVLCIALACKKEPETHYDLVKHKNSGTVTALLNGKAWQSDLTMTALNSGSEQRIYIHADVYVNGTVRQALSIGGIYLNNDKQVVYNAMNWIVFEQVGSPKKGKDTCVSSFQLVDGDVVENGYSILEDEENFIQFEGYDKTSPKARGRFQLTLYRFQPNTYPQTQGLPDTLRFTNGKIDVQIMKYDFYRRSGHVALTSYKNIAMRLLFVFLLVFSLFSDVSAQYVHSPAQGHIAGYQTTKRASPKTTNTNWRLQSYSKYYDNGQGLGMTDSAIYYYSADRHSEFDYMEMQYSDWGLHSQVDYDNSDIYMDIGNGIQLVGKYSCLYDNNSNKSQFTTTYNLTGQFENRDKHNAVLNASGRPDVEYWLNWNIATPNWDTTEIHSYTYDGSGRLIADSVTNGLSRMPSEISTYVYDANGNMIESKYSFWVGQWVPNRRESYTYYPSSKVMTILTEENKWQNWINTALDSFGYSSAKEYTYKLHRRWDTAAGSWNNISLETRILNIQDVPGGIFLVEWDSVSNSWDSVALAYCDYDMYGNIRRIEGYTYINGTKNSNPEYAANYYYEHYFNVNVTSSFSSDAGIHMYPNPVSSNITIDGIPEGARLFLSNVAGVQVYSGVVERPRQLIDLSYLQPGVYFLTVTDATGMTYTHRLIKQ